VVRAEYVPRRGDLVWLYFDPQTGHEQAGRRPALVLSPESYNGRVGLAIFCPVTSRTKGYPFEVGLPSGSEVSGVLLSDQVKSLDWRARRADLIESLPPEVTDEVLGKLGTLLG
jgi:mRNA interferase MazF